MVARRTTTKVPVEWGGDTFVFVRQSAARDLATSEALPQWLRVVYFAYANMTANGHAVLKPRELAAALGRKVDGVWVEPSSQQVSNYIAMAVEKGLLDPASGALCLVVPGEAIAGGLGDPMARCRRSHERRKQARPSLRVVANEAR
jgi:hypothetical protein